MNATKTRRVQPAPQPRRSSRLAPIIACLLLAALAFTVSGVFPFRQLFQQQRQVEATRERLQQLVEENQTLSAEVDALQTDVEVERIAREQYGLVRPGESAYVVIVPESAAAEAQPAAVELEEQGPWWARMWTWLTGGDVSADG